MQHQELQLEFKNTHSDEGKCANADVVKIIEQVHKGRDQNRAKIPKWRWTVVLFLEISVCEFVKWMQCPLQSNVCVTSM